MSNTELKTLGIIPARGGSKVLPKKNTRDLAGKPLIAYTIEAALQSQITRTIFSTDSEEIAEVARRCGAEVPFLRPAEYANDTATSLSVILHALEFMETEKDFMPDAVVFMQPTSPFRTAQHIDEALALYESEEATSVVGVTDVGDIHPYFMFEFEGHRLEPLIKMEKRPLRRQDLPSYYRLNGSLYVTRRDYFSTVESRDPVFSFDMAGYPMSAADSIDINDYLDFVRAETLLKGGDPTAGGGA